MPGFDISDSEWEEKRQEANKAFEMSFAGILLVSASIIFAAVNLLFGTKARKREEAREAKLKRDLQTVLKAKAEAVGLAARLKGQSDYKEQLLKIYQEHRETRSGPWLSGFFSGLPRPVREFIDEQSKREQ